MNLLKIAIAFALLVSAALAQTVVPQGRLTLTSNTPVMTGDVTGASIVYYTPYVGSYVPIYNGTSWSNYQISQLQLTLSSTYQLSGYIYDVFLFLNAGTVTIGATTTYWPSSNSRGTNNCAVIQQTQGIWVNSSSFSGCAANNGSTLYNTTGAGQATYVGSIYTTANGQTSMQFKPASASGGSNNVLGLYNAYNRVRINSYETDSAASWTYAAGTWEALNGASSNTKNRVSWLDGLQQSAVAATYGIYLTSAGAADIGVTLDAISEPTIQPGLGGGTSVGTSIAGQETFVPQLGWHYLQAMQWASGGTTTFYGSGVQFLTVSLDM